MTLTLRLESSPGSTLPSNLAITWTFECSLPLPFGEVKPFLLGETRDLKFCMDRLFSLENQQLVPVPGRDPGQGDGASLVVFSWPA